MRRLQRQRPGRGRRKGLPARRLPGAVHLPGTVLHRLTLPGSAGFGSSQEKRSACRPADTLPCEPWVEASPEDSLVTWKASVAALSVLQHLVCHSGAVACLLLSGAGAGACCRRRRPEPGSPGHSHEDADLSPRGACQGPRPASTLEDAPSPSGFLFCSNRSPSSHGPQPVP